MSLDCFDRCRAFAMGSGRTLTVTVISARGLANKDDGNDVSDPYVLVCFDGLTQHTLGRTTTIPDNLSPDWNETFTVDLTSAMRAHKELGLAKPAELTFVVRDADEGYDEPLGMATIPLKTLLTAGEVEGQYDINDGEGKLHVRAKVRRAKVNSMGYAASTGIGGIIGYLTGRNRRRRRRDRMQYSDSDNSYYGGAWNGGGVGYGYYNSDTSDEDNELNDWWEMDDTSSDEDEDNIWFSSNQNWESGEDDNDGDDDDDEAAYSDEDYDDDGE